MLIAPSLSDFYNVILTQELHMIDKGPALTTYRDVRLLIGHVKVNPFSPSPQPRHQWQLDGHVNVRTLVHQLQRARNHIISF